MEKGTFTPNAFFSDQALATNQSSNNNPEVPSSSPATDSTYCDLESETSNENFYLQTEYEADLDLLLLQEDIVNDPRVPPPAELSPYHTRVNFLKGQPPLSWSFASLHTNATIYKAVISGTSNQFF